MVPAARCRFDSGMADRLVSPSAVASLLALLDRAVPVAAAAARGARAYALAASAAAAVIAVYLLRDGLPDGGGEAAAEVVALLLAAVPPVVLFLFSAALAALAELPERLRRTRATGREHAAELARVTDRARSARGSGGLLRLPVLLWRLGRIVRSSRELLTPYAGVAPLASVPFLAWTAAAAAAAAIEIAVAVVLLAVLALG